MLTNKDLQSISKIVHKEIKSETDPIKESIRKLEKKLDFSIKFLDREFTKRIKRIEEHLGLGPID